MTQTIRIVIVGLGATGLIGAGVWIGASILGLLSVISIILAASVIVYKNPVISILWLIGLFFTVAIYLIIIGMDFIGLSYLLVYVGAVSILFLFILMLINIRISELLSDTKNSILLLILIVLLFSVTFIDMVPSQYANLFNSNLEIIFISSSNCWEDGLAAINNIVSLGYVMYTNYSILLILVSSILLVAMVGAIIITIKSKDLYPNINSNTLLPLTIKNEMVCTTIMLIVVGTSGCSVSLSPELSSMISSMASSMASSVASFIVSGIGSDIGSALLKGLNRDIGLLDLFFGKSKDSADIFTSEFYRDTYVWLVNTPTPYTRLYLSADALRNILAIHYTTLPDNAAITEFLSNPLTVHRLIRDIDNPSLGSFSPDVMANDWTNAMRLENDIITPVRQLIDGIVNNTLTETVTISGELVSHLASLLRCDDYLDVSNTIINAVFTGRSLLQEESVTFSSEFLRNTLGHLDLDFSRWTWYRIVEFTKLKAQFVETHCAV